VAGKRDRAALRIYQPIVIGLLFTCLVSSLMAIHRSGRELPGLEALERRTLDVRFELRGPTRPGLETVIIAYDDRTLTEDPHLFANRAGWAELLTALSATEPKAIGIDAFFPDAEQILPADLARDIDRYLSSVRPGPDAPADRLLFRVQAECQGDARFIAALRATKNVVLGFHLGLNGGPQLDDPNLGRGKYGQSIKGPYDVREAHQVIGSAPMFTAAARGLGMITVMEDATQAVREIPLVRRYRDSYFTPLSVQLIALQRGLSRGALAYLGGDSSIRIGSQVIRLNQEDGILLNFRGPAGTFPTYSAIDVLRRRLDPAVLRGRIVLLALTHLGHDTTRTPFGSNFPGVEVQATAIDNLLRGDYLRRASFRTDALLCLGLGLLISILFWPKLRLSPFFQTAGALLLFCGEIGVGFFLFSHRSLWVSFTGPFLTFIAVSGACLASAYAQEGGQRRRLRRAFSHYLADGVIAELMSDPSALSLGGARRQLSVLFSDIRNFTTLSEKQSPEQLIRFLNTYLTPMTDAVLTNGGFLDKFIGDAVMAVFGAPVKDQDHPASALRCALAMYRALSAVQPAVKEFVGTEIAIGIGINSGDMVVGNMGSRERFNYTVIGDAVNLSSRLEGLTKVYGVFCLVGSNTRRAARGDFTFREVDLVQVKGKDEPVAIYELLSGPGTVIASYTDLGTFERGAAAYRAGRFSEARKEFTAFANQNPHDRVAPPYLNRLSTLGDEASSDWSGIFLHSSK
jgi:adenylate cyclase